MRLLLKAQVSDLVCAAGRKGRPDWRRSMPSSRLVGAAIAGIEEHALSSARVGDLAASLGISDRHLRRITEAELGVSPIELAQTQRLLLAKRLLRETALDLTDIAFASGFGSVRRFNALFKSRYGLSPRAIRGKSIDTDSLSVQLEFRPPLAWKSLLAYLRLRAIPGVESADDTHYRRTVAIGAAKGWIAVSMHAGGEALNLELSPELTPVIGAVIGRVKQLFDLGAAPDSVSMVLRQDDMLAATVRRLPGLRVAGAFDGFELAVRTVLGQQVSVKGASTLAGRWAQAFGEPIATPYPELNRLSPSARTHGADPRRATRGAGHGRRPRPLLDRRWPARLRRARSCWPTPRMSKSRSTICMRLPGIGHWTANYIAMRALHWPDAFPAGDLVLMRAARSNQKQLQQRSEAWRPWRAYAAHYLWQSSGVAP